MSTWRKLLVAAALAVAACSSDSGAAPDARMNVPDAPPGGTTDAPPTAATFADFVKDLIVNKTADDTPPVTVDFTSTDSADPNEFGSLFQ